MDNYLDTLNDSQRAAVEYLDGPQLVIAGAGSGKTRVLTCKVAYLLQHGFPADRIMALTFTKKAAGEMRERINQLVGPSANRLWMGTFHSIFSRILRAEAEAIDFKSDFTIYDQTDSRNLVKTIIKELQFDEKVYKPAAIQAQISKAKNNLITPYIYSEHPEWIAMDREEKHEEFHNIYRIYWQRCYQAKAMDFDDLLLYTNILFRDHPEILERYQDYFQYLLVDEYQDTNSAQHLIVEQLVRKHHNLCVVGDDAQSIYSFRGANIANILRLQKTIPGTKLFKLERNYRSTRNIVDAANSLIRANKEQIPKTIYSEKDRGSLISVTGSFSDLEEAYTVSTRIADLHDNSGYNYSDIAILYRTNAQSRVFEEELRKRGIAYRIYGGLSFYQRKEIKDIIAYMRLIVNPADEEAFKRIVNYPPRGIGETTVRKIAECVSVHDKPFFEICAQPALYNLDVNRGTAAKLMGFADFIGYYARLNQTENAYDLTVRLLTDSGIRADLGADASTEGKSRQENVDELLGAIKTFVTMAVDDGRDDEVHLTDFLSDVSLSGDVEPEEKDDAPQDCVTLMTIHASKGLEFKNVFVVGIEEGLMPSDMCGGLLKGVEEERRLFYVALTRAEENCFLSYARSRFRNGRTDMARPSRFLSDIDARYLKRNDAVQRPAPTYGDEPRPRPSIYGSKVPVGTPSSPVKKPISSVLDFTGRVHKSTSPERPKATDSLFYEGRQLRTGQVVMHDRFGRGVIRALMSDGDEGRIQVDFADFGSKILLLKFMKLRFVDE